MENKELSDKEVLQKAIEVAIGNGYYKDVKQNIKGISKPLMIEAYSRREKGFKLLAVKFYYRVEENTFLPVKMIEYTNFIFSHEFAKAFWSSVDNIIVSHNHNMYKGNRFDYTYKSIPIWKFHLQQMVLEENPINYLRKFI